VIETMKMKVVEKIGGPKDENNIKLGNERTSKRNTQNGTEEIFCEE
jgi:hypothetical protein